MQIKRARERIVMSLCIIFLLFAPISATAQSNSMKVSLNLKSASVKEFFDAVKAQTGLNFIYNTEQVKSMSRITIQSKGQPITEVLDKVLANTGYTYEIEGNIVTIVFNLVSIACISLIKLKGALNRQINKATKKNES